MERIMIIGCGGSGKSTQASQTRKNIHIFKNRRQLRAFLNSV